MTFTSWILICIVVLLLLNLLILSNLADRISRIENTTKWISSNAHQAVCLLSNKEG